MTYKVDGKNYVVDSVEYGGEVINVLGMSITKESKGYTVFDVGDELYFSTFEEAYQYVEEHAGIKKNISCCICGKEIDDYGNSPDGAGWKTKDGKIEFPTFSPDDRCCDDCNSRYVIPGRLYSMKNRGTH